MLNPRGVGVYTYTALSIVVNFWATTLPSVPPLSTLVARSETDRGIELPAFLRRRQGSRMNVLAENDGKTYEAAVIAGPDCFACPLPCAPFPCLIWDHGSDFTDGQRLAVAKKLLEAGCRYVVCGGADCEAWHDAIDWEFVQQHLNDAEEICHATHVMTTGHEGESPREVAYFFVHLTNFAEHDFMHYLVLHVATGPAAEQVNAAVRDEARNKDAV